MANIQKATMWAGIGLILATGLIHLNGAADSFNEATYKGLLFVANGIAAGIAATGIYRGAKGWGWGLGLLVSLGALLGYIVSRTVGLPGLEAESDAWFEQMGVASMVAEGLFAAIAIYVLTRQPATSAERPARVSAKQM